MTARTIYVIDDNPAFLESTRFWLSGAGFDVHTWDDPSKAVAALGVRDRRLPACLMLDVRMPGLSGLDLHDALAEQDALLPVIYMSGHADVSIAVTAMQKGAVTLLEKPFDEGALEQALDLAFTQTRPRAIAPAAGQQENAERQAAFAARESRLAPRERQVLGYVVQGVYNKNIADRIGLSIKTVEVYRARGMAKMQARSVAELTRMMVSKEV